MTTQSALSSSQILPDDPALPDQGKDDFHQIAVFGAGAIGQALVEQLLVQYPQAAIHWFSRRFAQETPHSHTVWERVICYRLDYLDEPRLMTVIHQATQTLLFDLVWITTGILHEGDITPEKSLRELSAEKFQHVMTINTIIPALLIKHCAPRLTKQKRAVMAVLSARIGSISENKKGGWYAYRASKAALNMVLKNSAIEIGRTHPLAMIVGLHPGTVDSALSQPFQRYVPPQQLLTPTQSAQYLLQVIHQLTHEDSGHQFAWDGQQILP